MVPPTSTLTREDSSAGGGREREGGPLHNSIERIDSGQVRLLINSIIIFITTVVLPSSPDWKSCLPKSMQGIISPPHCCSRMFGSFSRLVVVNHVEGGDVQDGHVEGGDVHDVHLEDGDVHDVHMYEGGDVCLCMDNSGKICTTLDEARHRNRSLRGQRGSHIGMVEGYEEYVS